MSNKIRISQSGSGAPSAIVPHFKGELYINETSGELWRSFDMSAGNFTKLYDASILDASLGNYVKKTGDTMTGNLVINASLWVSRIYGSDLSTGTTTLILDSTSDTNKGIVYVSVGGSAVLAGKFWAQSSGFYNINDNDTPLGLASKRWTTIYGRNLDISTYATIANIQFQDGSITLQNKKIAGLSLPINSSDAVNKFYVDSSFALKTDINSSLGNYVLKTGDTVTGNLFIDASLTPIKNVVLQDTSYNSGNSYGIIYKDNSTFLHNFNYGWNATVTTAGGNTFLGMGAGNLTMGSTATVGNQASYNTGIGRNVLRANTTGYGNTGVGNSALYSNLSGWYNTAVGMSALDSVDTGYYNTAVGVNAAQGAAGAHSNTAVGYQSLYTAAGGDGNTAIGLQSLYRTGGHFNVAAGYNSLYSISGSYNVGIGYNAGRYATAGMDNSIGSFSIYIGSNTKSYISGSQNEIVIGNNAIGLGTNTITIGDASIIKTALFGNVGINQLNPSTSLDVSGNVAISGHLQAATKSFYINHPTQKGKKLQYGSLEGPEYGVYHRGRLYNNNIIELPEYWSTLVDKESVTINLTPKNIQFLYIKKIEENKIIIGKIGFGKIDCYYTVYGERKDVAKLIIEQ